ncbi:helix-turn-helix domain-containing protein [Haemophilus seminalis]|uniref:helix-turn-helix domain-containing protein n=1 Tax=Haemophilus seminalis TaxID=2582921 RepID=UPI0025551033|nr:helix-turn-helix domain-containing protein [Haemophilus seminalis]MDK7281572.1 helix-turn-helix domain-containing protein [Haemophilus seminalis]
MGNINPNEKTSQTQNGKILKALLNGERLTQLDAYTRFNCTRLGARIYDIKNMNEEYKNKVVDRWVVLPSGKRVKEYRFEA